MSATLTIIARTISEELERAVAAAEEAQNAGLDGITSHIKTVISSYNQAIGNAVELERDAAQIVARAIKMREAAQSELNEALITIIEKTTSLRAEDPRRLSKPLSPLSLEGEAVGADL